MQKVALALLVSVLALPGLVRGASQGGPLPGPLPLFPATNWWNRDITTAPVDLNSASFINFIGATRGLHADFGGIVATNEIYGIPYVLVNSSQPKVAVQFDYWDESDGVNMQTGQGIPFYPIPLEAITQPYWIEGGPPGNDPSVIGDDRHMLIVDTDNKFLYELYSLYWNGSNWQAGSGAFFDLKTNNRRPEGWTSADAAGLAILPGLVRYDEVFGTAEIGHAFRMTVRDTNGHVFPASHTAGSRAGALPMGARLRLKANTNISGFSPEVQRIFRAMKKYGLIVADNGSDMYVTGTFDTRWPDNLLSNSVWGALKASDFEVIQLGWNPPICTPPTLSVNDVSASEGNTGSWTNFVVSLSGPACGGGPVTVNYATADGTASVGSDYGVVSGTLTIPPGQLNGTVPVPILADRIQEANETFTLNLAAPSGATLADTQGLGTITNDDSAGLTIADVVVTEPRSGQTMVTLVVTLSPASGTAVTVNAGTANGTASSGLDYTATSVALTFDPGVTTRTVTVPILPDALAERMETFVVNLTGETGAAVVVGQATARILDPAAGDMNGDGRGDILWQHSPDGALATWFMNGAIRQNFSYLNPSAVPDANWKIVGTGFFNDDNQADILWQHQTSFALVLWYMNGVTRQSFANLNPGAVADPNWKVIGTGDFDYDGRPDLLWRNLVSGQIVIWYMNNFTRTSFATLQPPVSSQDWLVGAVADLSGDGRPDIVWQQKSTGLLTIWTVVGGVRTRATVLTPSNVPANALGWRIVAAPDMNGDGKADLLWRYETTGDLVVWYMNGTTRTSHAFLSPSAVTDLGWRIVGPR